MINQYRVFQIKEVHHQHWAKSYAQQVEDGFLIHHQNYQSAYKGKPAPSDTPMTARKRLEEKRPNTFIGRSFGVGDVIVWDEEKERKFFYVDKEELVEFGGFMDADAAGNTVVYMVPNYQIDGKTGTWLPYDSEVVEGVCFFMMRNEQRKDTVSPIVVDSKGVFVTDAPNGFENVRAVLAECVYRTWKGECRNMIAAYQRISRADGDLGKDGKDKSNSIENQKELILRYISCKESLQNVPVMDFVDDGYTGSNFDRPGFQQMMDGVRNGKIDTIIVKDLSRFGRDYIGVGEYMEQIFPLLGVRLIAINDNYDSNNYKGTTLGMDVIVSNLVNTMYCRDAGKKLRTANQVKWRKGITTASAAPFGYQFDPDKKGAFIIDPPAAKIVRRIFDLAILGLGTRDIAMMLNDESVPVPSVYNKENKAYGKETTYTIAPVILWDSSRVWKILTAYVYTGAMVLGKTKTLISGKSIIRTVPKGQRYITEGTHEAIVSREEFEKAQLVIKSNSHKVLMGGVDFPLKGKVRCGNCRRVMAHNFKQVVPTFWCREGLELVGQTQCTSEIFQVSDIESAVFQALKRELSLLDSLYGDIQKEEQDLKEAHKKANRRKTLMEQELKNLKGEKMRMYEEYAAGTLPLDTYKQKKQECDRRISEVQEQIEQSKAEESVQSVVPGTMRAAAEQAENFLNGTRLTAGMVSAFIENVFVYGDGRIVVRFKYEQSIQDAARALHKS